MSRKTRKNSKKRFVNKKNTDAINATQPKCLMKTCIAKNINQYLVLLEDQLKQHEICFIKN